MAIKESSRSRWCVKIEHETASLEAAGQQHPRLLIDALLGRSPRRPLSAVVLKATLRQMLLVQSEPAERGSLSRQGTLVIEDPEVRAVLFRSAAQGSWR